MTYEIQRQNRIVGALAVLLAVAVVLGSFLYTTDMVTVTYTMGDETVGGLTLRGFDPWFAPDPELREGEAFLGWQDQFGRMYPRDRVKAYEDLELTAVYRVPLNLSEHIGYLPLRGGVLACADEALTRGEAAVMLHTLLSGEVTPARYYPDVPETADYYEAAAVLHALGVEHSILWFRGEDPITKGELADWLTCFFPVGTMTRALAPLNEDRDSTLTRAEAARVMNGVLGRQPAEGVTEQQVGIVPDLDDSHPLYPHLAEALTTHRHHFADDGTERRRNWRSLQQQESGPVLVGTTLYGIDDTGHLVCDDTIDGFRFDENGVYTSGMPELDVLVQKVLKEIIRPGMTAEQRLQAVYYYTVDGFTYLRRNYYPIGAKGFAEKEAYTMLSTGYGNCYCYASVFYQLARALGEDARIYAGLVEGQYPHGWVEFEIDGQRFVCDPELEMVTKQRGYHNDMYMLDQPHIWFWAYIR